MLTEYEQIKKTREQLCWFLALIPLSFYFGPAFLIAWFGG